MIYLIAACYFYVATGKLQLCNLVNPNYLAFQSQEQCDQMVQAKFPDTEMSHGEMVIKYHCVHKPTYTR